MVKMLVQVEAMFSGSIWGLGEKATEGKFHPSEHQQILIWDILSRARHKNLKGGVLQTLTKGGSGVMDERGRRFEGQLCIMKEVRWDEERKTAGAKRQQKELTTYPRN